MKGSKLQSFRLPAAVFALVVMLLTIVQVKVDPPMLLLERFIPGGGWAELILIGIYGAVVSYHMQDPLKVHAWRKYTWFSFSLIFLAQLMLGLLADARFLMSGDLHLPVPMMILAGPIYRGHPSIMSLLFVSTVVISGPAWCSHLCYFGGLDSLAATKKRRPVPMHNKWALKSTVLLLVIASAIFMRWLQIPVGTSTLLAAGFGVVGLGVILFSSRATGNMVHCTAYCPLGTVVNLTRFVNPLRLTIDRASCTECMACFRSCRYDALRPSHIRKAKPGLTCTLCGDCISTCHENSIRYRFPFLSAGSARLLYLCVTVTLHATTLALARI